MSVDQQNPDDFARAAVQRERERMAALIHDPVLQLLMSASQDLAALADGDAEALAHARAALAQGIAELRQLFSEPD